MKFGALPAKLTKKDLLPASQRISFSAIGETHSAFSYRRVTPSLLARTGQHIVFFREGRRERRFAERNSHE